MKPWLEGHFYETYQFAFAVRNILNDQVSYLRSLHDFYGDGSIVYFSQPFPRRSAFHDFLLFVIDSLLLDGACDEGLSKRQDIAKRFANTPEALRDLQPEVLPIELALRHHQIEYESFAGYLAGLGKHLVDADDDDLSAYLDDLQLSEAYETLVTHSVREVFYLLFANRPLLMTFNIMMSDVLRETNIGEVPEDLRRFFATSGVLKRCRVPRWAKRAVFFRDRGRCVSCQADLSGLLQIWAEDEFDHIVPLSLGGLNDVTNLQLMCKPCNLRKGDGEPTTSNLLEDWYPLTEQD